MRRWIQATLLGAVFAALPAATLADKVVDVGKHEYLSKCAVCHAEDGKGAGPYAEMLYNKPADLTTLSKRNGGVFPLARLYNVIDGRVLFPVHGTREMPIWGDVYKLESANYYVDMSYDDVRYTRTRILSLLDYLSRIQDE